MPNKSYAYLLNAEPSNLVLLKIYKTEFDEIIITFTDQNGRPLAIEDKVKLTLLINKQKWRYILYNQHCENMLKDMVFYPLWENFSTNKKHLFDKGLETVKIASRKAFHKAAEATGEIIGNKIADKFVKSKQVIDENLTDVE